MYMRLIMSKEPNNLFIQGKKSILLQEWCGLNVRHESLATNILSYH